MRILLIGPLPQPINGVSFANEVLCKALTANGVKVGVINTSTEKISAHQGSKFSFGKAFGFVHTYSQIFKVLKADVVYTTPGQTFFGILKYAPFFLLSLIFSKSYVIHVHGNYLGKEFESLEGWKRKVFGWLISKASAGIVLSTSLTKNFEGLLPSKKVFIVENFVTPEVLAPAAKPKLADLPRIIFLSNLMKDKGVLEVLEALKILTEQNVDFRAVFAGSIENGLEDVIIDRIADLGTKVEYVNTISGAEKKDRLEEANIFVLPTYYIMEGQPISILEGMATGNIILATPHAGIPDVVSLDNGYFVEKNSPESIAETIKMISLDLEFQLAKFSAHNRAYAQSRFTEASFVNGIQDVISKTIQSE